MGLHNFDHHRSYEPSGNSDTEGDEPEGDGEQQNVSLPNGGRASEDDEARIESNWWVDSQSESAARLSASHIIQQRVQPELFAQNIDSIGEALNEYKSRFPDDKDRARFLRKVIFPPFSGAEVSPLM